MAEREENSSGINDWITDLIKSPLEYINDKKLEYRARIEGSLDRFRVTLADLTSARDKLNRSGKWDVSVGRIEDKMGEVRGHLESLKDASVESWEAIRSEIEIAVLYIEKHLNKLSRI